MRSQTIEYTHSDRLQSAMTASREFGRQSRRMLRAVFRASVAMLPALAVLVLAVWAISRPDMLIYFRAVTWTAGFLSVGLAIDARTARGALMYLSFGAAMPTIAWLSARLGPEWLMLAAAAVAAWVAACIYRR